MARSRGQIRAKTASSSGQFPQIKGLTTKTLGGLVVRTLATLFLATLSAQICKLSLSPIYGSIPSESDIDWLLVPLTLLFLIVPEHFWASYSTLLPVLGYLPPLTLPILTRCSGRLGPIWGPRITYACTSFPILYGSIASAAAIVMRTTFWRGKSSARQNDRFLRYVIQEVSVLLLGYVFIQVLHVFDGAADVLMIWIMSSTSRTLSSRHGMQALIATLWAPLARSKLTASFGLLPLLYVLFFNPHVPMAQNTAIANATLQAAGWSLVARQESLTGYLSVLDNVKDGFRVMRCDHSLLGGEWINKPEGHPAKFNEPIYSIFVMLEAVRLIETRSKRIKTFDDEHALVIGLGVGTAPAALIAHGIHTTTIEIDPIVHEYATDYFNLPRNHTSIIGDATEVVKELQSTKAQRKYDYIIHDVFTGGAEPIELFTFEFLTNLSNLLTSDGVIAINYAGDLLLPSAISVIRTVLSVFGNCRLFREVPEPALLETEDFTNLVMFCRNSREHFTFRSPEEADFLGSPARRQHLLPRNEMADVQRIVENKGEILKRGRTKWLEASQRRSALGHWYVMRKVLPDIVWENW